MPAPAYCGEVVELSAPATIAPCGRAHRILRSGACPEHVEPLLKFVAGVGGDEIDIDGYGVRINGARWPMSVPQHVDDLAALKTTSWDATPRLRRCDDNLDAASE